MNHDDLWRVHAACAETSPDVFFKPDQRTVPAWTPRPALEICASCPVVVDCLEDALARNETGGIFGGAGHEIRRWIRRSWRTREHNGYEPGCTCDYCTAVTSLLDRLAVIDTRRRIREAQERNPDPGTVKIARPRAVANKNGPGATHGRASTYARGCHCPPCSDAIRAHQAARQAAKHREAS